MSIVKDKKKAVLSKSNYFGYLVLRYIVPFVAIISLLVLSTVFCFLLNQAFNLYATLFINLILSIFIIKQTSKFRDIAVLINGIVLNGEFIDWKDVTSIKQNSFRYISIQTNSQKNKEILVFNKFKGSELLTKTTDTFYVKELKKIWQNSLDSV